MIKKVLSIALLLFLAASVSSFGATSITNVMTSGTSADHIQVWLTGFNLTNLTTDTLTSGAAMTVYKTGKTGTTANYYNTGTYEAPDYRPVASLWGVATTATPKAYPTPTGTPYDPVYDWPITPTPTYIEPWRDWVGDKTVGSETYKVAVMDAPSYINGANLFYYYRNTDLTPDIGYTVNIQYYKDQVLVESRLYTKLTATGDGNITNAATSAWSLSKLTVAQSGYDPGFIDKYGVSIPEPGSILALLVGLGSLAAYIRRKR